MPETGTLPAAKKSSPGKLWLNVLLLIALVGVFAWQIHSNWPEVVKYPWHGLRWEWAMWAFAGLLLCSLCDIIIWNRALGWFTESLPFAQAVPVFIWSNIARYIPGKVFSLLVRAGLGHHYQRHPVPVLAASVLELAVRLASALMVFLFTLPTWQQPPESHMESLLIMLACIVVVLMIGAHPRIMLPVLNWGLKKIKQHPIERRVRYRDVLWLLAAETVRWLAYGGAFLLLACAVYLPSAHVPFALIGIANAAWAAGFVGMAPAGLGLAEIVQKIFMGALGFPIAVSLILPVLMRMGSLAAEGIWALVAWPLHISCSRRLQQAGAVVVKAES